MKNSPFKKDWSKYFPILIVVLIVLEVSVIVWASNKNWGRAHKFAVITVDSKEEHRIRLSEPTELDIRGAHISIKYGRVRFTESDCKDQTCIKGGNIRQVGSALACLEKNITVQIVKADD